MSCSCSERLNSRLWIPFVPFIAIAYIDIKNHLHFYSHTSHSPLKILSRKQRILRVCCNDARHYFSSVAFNWPREAERKTEISLWHWQTSLRPWQIIINAFHISHKNLFSCESIAFIVSFLIAIATNGFTWFGVGKKNIGGCAIVQVSSIQLSFTRPRKVEWVARLRFSFNGN